MIISFIYDVTLSKFVDSSFPQCNVHTGVQGVCVAFTPLDSYLKLRIDLIVKHVLYQYGILGHEHNNASVWHVTIQ